MIAYTYYYNVGSKHIGSPTKYALFEREQDLKPNYPQSIKTILNYKIFCDFDRLKFKSWVKNHYPCLIL